MQDADTVYIIDIGNTLVKVARFQNDALIDVERFNDSDLDKFNSYVERRKGNSIVSSVRSDSDTMAMIEFLDSPFIVSASSALPVSLNYETETTLGIDRICNAAFLNSKMESDYAVSVDVGTCIKFDLVSKIDGYLGGSISPGIHLRYKSLNDYTGKLPLLSNKSGIDIVGTDTNSSMQSGVINGINAELNGVIEQYRSRYSSLTFFMTGGDAKYFDILSKNDIFADENLTLSGLYEIYKHNA